MTGQVNWLYMLLAAIVFFLAGISIQLSNIDALLRASLPKEVSDKVKKEALFSAFLTFFKALFGVSDK